jgi:hypothetical protein
MAPAARPNLPIVPTPVDMQITYWFGATIIVRRWRPEEVPRCRLCPQCRANPPVDGASSYVCTVVIAAEVPASECFLFDLGAFIVARGYRGGPLGPVAGTAAADVGLDLSGGLGHELDAEGQALDAEPHLLRLPRRQLANQAQLPGAG